MKDESYIPEKALILALVLILAITVIVAVRGVA